jgi:hypothetical protein
MTPLGPFSLLAMDYCDFGIVATNGDRYVLVMCDVYALRVYLFSSPTESADFAARACVKIGATVMDFYSIFTDQGSHFTARFTEEVLRLKRTNQFFAIADVQYTRGLAEQAVKKSTNVLRKFLVAARIRPELWPEYLDAAAAIINNTPSATLRGASPNEICFGEGRLPGVAGFDTGTGAPRRIITAGNPTAFVQDFGHRFKTIRRTIEEQRFGRQPKPNARSLQSSFIPKQDYVFIAEAEPRHKLVPRWSRLASVEEETGSRSYRVTELATGTTTEQHVSNLRRCSGVAHGSKLSSWEHIFYSLFVVNGISHVDNFSMTEDTPWCTVHFADDRNAPIDYPVASWLPMLRLYFAALLETDEIPDGDLYDAITDLLAL